MRSRRSLAALLLTGAALGAGCGGGADEENAYVDEVAGAQQAYTARFGQISRRLTATSSLAQDRETLAAFAGATRRFADALEKLEPPARVRDEHAGLIEAVVGYERQVVRGRNRLRDGSSEARAAVRTDLSSSVEGTQAEIAAAVAAINAELQD